MIESVKHRGRKIAATQTVREHEMRTNWTFVSALSLNLSPTVCMMANAVWRACFLNHISQISLRLSQQICVRRMTKQAGKNLFVIEQGSNEFFIEHYRLLTYLNSTIFLINT